MSDAPSPALSEAAQAVADSKIPPGDEYEEIREQVREEYEERPETTWRRRRRLISKPNFLCCAF